MILPNTHLQYLGPVWQWVHRTQTAISAPHQTQFPPDEAPGGRANCFFGDKLVPSTRFAATTSRRAAIARSPISGATTIQPEWWLYAK